MAFDMLFRRNPPQTLGVAPPGMRDVSRASPGVPIFDITMTAIAFLGVLLRLYTRAWIKAAAGWDDALIIVGMVSLLDPDEDTSVMQKMRLDRRS